MGAGDCGVTLMRHISPTYCAHEKRFNSLLERMKSADRARGGTPPCSI
jgi:hypothetical protein